MDCSNTSLFSFQSLCLTASALSRAMAHFLAPPPTLYVSVHHARLPEPYLLSIALPRITSYRTTFETIRKLVVSASKRSEALRGLRLEEDGIRRCSVDGMDVAWRSSPEQVSGLEDR